MHFRLMGFYFVFASDQMRYSVCFTENSPQIGAKALVTAACCCRVPGTKVGRYKGMMSVLTRNYAVTKGHKTLKVGQLMWPTVHTYHLIVFSISEDRI